MAPNASKTVSLKFNLYRCLIDLKFTHALTHAAPEEGVDYNRPRVESPSYSSGEMIVLQQYIDGRARRALFFSVPAVGP